MSSCRNLLRRQASRISLAPYSRPEYEVGLARLDRCDQGRDELCGIASVTVEKDDDLYVLAQGSESRLDGAPVATPRFDDHPRAGRNCTFRRPICGGAVDDNHLCDALGQHGGDDRADRVLLVKTGDDGGNYFSHARHGNPPVRRGAKLASQTPAQPAIGAGRRRLIGQERSAKRVVCRPVPDVLHALLGGIAQCVVFITMQ